MLEAILRFGKKLEQGGVGLFFYAGHGVQVDRQNFLIPLRARIEKEEHVEFEAVKVDRGLAEIAAADNQMNIVVLDACRNNPYARSFRSQKRGLARLSAPGETFIAYATAPGAVAADGSGRNSPFTASLLQELPRPGLKVEDVFKRVAAAVKKKSNGDQSPWRTTSLTIDFYFIPPVPGALPVESGRKVAAGTPIAVIDLSRSARLGMEFVPVRGGTFQMGDQWGDGYGDEKPVHAVTLSDFEMSKHEITVGQFRAFVSASGYQTTAEKQGWAYVYEGSGWVKKQGANWRAPGFLQTDMHPVVCVSWDDAVAFCTWLSQQEGKTVRLPTEAEWEFAARSRGQQRKYPWGDDFAGRQLNFADNNTDFSWSAKDVDDGFARTAPVASFTANDLGLFDMAGNVWEWCRDWYADKYESGAQTNPTGPRSGDFRVLRGGSWNNKARDCRTVNRDRNAPGGADNNNGFRVVRSVR